GMPVILQRSSLSPTISLRVITPLAEFPEDSPAEPHRPAWNLSSLGYDVLADQLATALAAAREAIAAARPWSDSTGDESLSPEGSVDQYFTEILGLKPTLYASPLAPVAVIVSGDIDVAQATADIEGALGALSYSKAAVPMALEAATPMDVESTLRSPMAQVHLGYVAPAPGPSEPGSTQPDAVQPVSDQPGAAAWRMALYILSHGYEGRLGKEAIGNRGLIYYIDNAYQTDGRNGWITVSMGVDPDKLPAMKQLLRETLLQLETHPPTQQEVDEARQYLLGRQLSAAQSNTELADRLGHNWLWYGSQPSYAEMQRRFDAVQRQDILDLLPAFTSGSTVAIRNPAGSVQ
ncbi:MAG: M16 family metallopeptidase, partial [Lysobacterales bacterium]